MRPIAEWRKAAQTFEAGGRRLAYWTSGAARDRPSLLLIHGFPTSSWDWTAIWPTLAPRFRLVAMDLLGFGLSDKPDVAYTIVAQADLIEALLSHLGTGETHVLAHDYGDTVGQELLARFNEGDLSFKILSMCFLNGGLFPERHCARPIQKLGLTPLGPLIGLFMSRARLRNAFDDIWGSATKASEQEIDGHWALIRENGGTKVFHKLLRYIPERVAHRERWVGALKKSRAPLRLIDGGADPVSGAQMYRRYCELVPDADAVLLEAAGHYPHTEAPAEVATAFFDFHRRLGTIP